ncbi:MULTISPECIES: hypothetical protein [Chitinophagaceae]|uniref:hypothetical protein n=1 Tax=Chitinophagaceae TaxID=563835 RepID=UPI000DEFE4F3|nr:MULTISPECIES: hypothetical protein [Chitinophagaceae]RPD44244.1 hypothetical protein DRJ53_17855 [Paracnuella aquatica]
MTQKKFASMDRAQQRVYLLTEGTFLAERSTAAFDLMLYDLNGFYVEAAFYKQTNRVAYFKVLHNSDALEHYLADINLDGLLQELPF